MDIAKANKIAQLHDRHHGDREFLDITASLGHTWPRWNADELFARVGIPYCCHRDIWDMRRTYAGSGCQQSLIKLRSPFLRTRKLRAKVPLAITVNT
jgi:hypothetical protein